MDLALPTYDARLWPPAVAALASPGACAALASPGARAALASPGARAALASPGARAADVVFDMDGTLLAEDLGDELVAFLLEGGHRPPTWLERCGDLEGYRRLTRGWDTPDQFVLCALAIEGLDEAELERQVLACLAARVPLRGPIVALARQMAEVGHRVWILTGSSEGIGRAVARHLGLDPQRVIGLRLAQDPATGRFGSTPLPPIPCGAGKVQAAHQRIGAPVAFTIGDSWTDLPLLAEASLALAVPKLDGRLGPLARQAGIPVLSPVDLGG